MPKKFNPSFVEKVLTSFIKEELSKFHFQKGVLGLSGGLDSSVCAFLAARALKPENVLGLILPYGQLFREDVEDAQNVGRKLGIKLKVIDISPMVDAYFTLHPTQSKRLKGNKMARERMSILYDFSAREKALVLGTSNKSELLVGYGTLHGDMASSINPLGDLYKSQIRELASHLGVPEKIRQKKPTAGLWSGQTDEKELGISYDKLDEILFHLVDKRRPAEEVVDMGFQKEHVEMIIGMIKKSEFKRKPPPIPKLSNRTVDHDFLYPYDWDK